MCDNRYELPCLACLVWLLPAGPPIRAANPDAAQGVAYFEKHIRPLLAKRCYQCHSTRANKSEGGLRLDTRSGWSVGGDSGPAIIPGDVEASLFIRAVRYTAPDLQMPPDKPLARWHRPCVCSVNVSTVRLRSVASSTANTQSSRRINWMP